MYPLLDEAIHTTLSASTQTTLTKATVYYIGQQKLKAEPLTIDIAQSGDRLNSQRFDEDERLLTYILIVNLKKLDYLKAQELLRDLVKDIKTDLHSPTFTYSHQLTMGDIVPIYDDKGILRSAEIELLFTMDEDYSTEEETFDTAEVTGSIIDEEE